MLNAGANPGALREPRRITPTPPPLATTPVGNGANTGWNGGVHVQVMAPATPRTAKPKFDPRQLRHPDVVLPLIAAAIVLVVLLAWGA